MLHLRQPKLDDYVEILDRDVLPPRHKRFKLKRSHNLIDSLSQNPNSPIEVIDLSSDSEPMMRPKRKYGRKRYTKKRPIISKRPKIDSKANIKLKTSSSHSSSDEETENNLPHFSPRVTRGKKNKNSSRTNESVSQIINLSQEEQLPAQEPENLINNNLVPELPNVPQVANETQTDTELLPLSDLENEISHKNQHIETESDSHAQENVDDGTQTEQWNFEQNTQGNQLDADLNKNLNFGNLEPIVKTEVNSNAESQENSNSDDMNLNGNDNDLINENNQNQFVPPVSISAINENENLNNEAQSEELATKNICDLDKTLVKQENFSEDESTVDSMTNFEDENIQTSSNATTLVTPLLNNPVKTEPKSPTTCQNTIISEEASCNFDINAPSTSIFSLFPPPNETISQNNIRPIFTSTQLNSLVLSPGKSPRFAQKSPIYSPKAKINKFSPLKNLRKSTRKNLLSSFDSQSAASTSPSQENVPNVQYSSKYEQENFLSVLNSVLNDPYYAHLFTEQEKKITAIFNEVSSSAQFLYIRLFQRTMEWYSEANIKYKINIKDAFAELHDKKFLEEINDSTISLPDLLEILSKESLSSVGKKMGLKFNQTSNKDFMKLKLLTMAKTQRTLSKSGSGELIIKAALEIIGPTYRLTSEPKLFFKRICLLYSLPFDWDDEANKGTSLLKTIQQVKTGQMKFPSYNVSKSVMLFPTREDLERFHEGYKLRSEVEGALEAKNYTHALDLFELSFDLLTSTLENSAIQNHHLSLPLFLRAFSGGSLAARALSLSIDACQKTKNYSRAQEGLNLLLSQDIYLHSHRGRWHERFMLNLKHLKLSPKNTQNYLITALKDPRIFSYYKLNFSERLKKIHLDELKKKKKRKRKSDPSVEEADEETSFSFEQYGIVPYFLKNELPLTYITSEKMSITSERSRGKAVFIDANQNLSPNRTSDPQIHSKNISSVENVALNHYKRLGYHSGVHGEGAVVVSIFVLLFWDIVYDDSVVDVFQSPYQPYPLDLLYPNFYASRQHKINSLVTDIRNKLSMEEILEIIEKNWTQYEEIKECLVSWTTFGSVSFLKELVRSMGKSVIASICERLGSNFREFRSGFPDLTAWNGTDCIFVEVKGPNDTLSDKQSIWIDFLLSIGVKAEVCHVKSVSNKRIQIQKQK